MMRNAPIADSQMEEHAECLIPIRHNALLGAIDTMFLAPNGHE